MKEPRQRLKDNERNGKCIFALSIVYQELIYMEIRIDRPGFFMADDCIDHKVVVAVDSQEELEAFLREYLPYGYRNEDWVWVFYYCDKYDDKVFLYYYLTPIVSYFVSPENPPVLKERNRLTCGLMTEKRAKWEKDFPTEGNFLHRVRQYVEVQKKKI